MILGTGKEGKTYLIQRRGREYAKKVFSKRKSSDKIIKEGELQDIASRTNISPKVIECNPTEKYILMEKMDIHLFTSNKVRLSKDQQERIIEIFHKLDKKKIFNGDSNIFNYMVKKDKIYIIDFGRAVYIDDKFLLKFGTKTPNIDIMLPGLILKMREFKFPLSSYKYLMKNVSEDIRDKIGCLRVVNFAS